MIFRRKQINMLHQRLDEQPRFMIVVAGPRQIGKTTMVKQALSAYPSTFVATDQPCPRRSIHFADQSSGVSANILPGAPPTAEWLVRQWTQARANARAQTEGRCYVLAIDEIQKIPRWSEVVGGYGC